MSLPTLVLGASWILRFRPHPYITQPLDLARLSFLLSQAFLLHVLYPSFCPCLDPSISFSRSFAPRPLRKASSVSPEGGLASVADRLYAKYGSFLFCKSCTSSGRDRKGNYIKNVAGKRDGEDRYYRRWCCTANGKFSCPSLSNASYID
jgi:hypothetical protein